MGNTENILYILFWSAIVLSIMFGFHVGALSERKKIQKRIAKLERDIEELQASTFL